MSFAQGPGTPLITSYSPKQYGFDNQNWSIVKDNRGVLYFGNTKGILEFDGTSWRKIIVENDYGVRALAIDSSGTIYVGATGAFGYLAPDSLGKMQYNSISAKYDTATIKVFPDIWRVRILNNQVYFNAFGALYIYSPYYQTDDINKKIQAIYPQDHFRLSYAVNGKYYIQDSDKGLSILQGDTLKTILSAQQLIGHVVFAMIPDIDKDNHEEMLVALNDRLLKYDPIADTSNGEPMFAPFKTEADEFFVENSIYDVVKLPGKRFAVATLSKGAIVIGYQGNITGYVNSQNGLQDETVWSMSCFDNSLWLALNNGIAQVEITSPFRFWGEDSGIKGSVHTITRFNKTLFLGTSDGALFGDTVCNKAQGGISIFNRISIGNGEIWSFLKYVDAKSNDTTLLIGQSGDLYELNKYHKIDSVFDGTVFCMLQSGFNPDIIYCGGETSLVILKRDHQKKAWDVWEIDGFDGEIRSIAESGNELWATTFFNGVFRIKRNSPEDFFMAAPDDYEVAHYGTAHGLKGVKDIMVYNIDDELIFTTPVGIYKYDHNKNHFFPCDKFGKIFSDGKFGVYRFVQNREGNIWVDGTGILYKQSNGTYLFDTVIFKRVSQMRLSAIYPEKNFWYAGGPAGLLKYDKQIDYISPQGFNTIIRQVTINNDSLVFYGTNFIKNDSSGINIPSLVQPNQLKPVIDFKFNNLTFEYSSPYFILPKSTGYSYKLDGFDDNWSQWNLETKKGYTNLRQGKYVFQVKAKNLYGSESEIASYRFQILPPWYGTWWAYTCYAILLIFLILIIVKLNARRLVEAKIQLEKIVKQRTEEISQQKNEIETIVEELKATNATKDKLFSIIAHDLRSPFNTIFGFTGLLKENYSDFSEDERIQFINEIDKSSKSAFQLLENLLLWALSQQGKISIQKKDTKLKQLVVEAISPYLYSSDKKEITIGNSISGDISVYVDGHTIKTVLANLFNNAVKFTPNKGNITIGAAIKDKFVEIKVSDTGIGIPAGILDKIFRVDENHSTLGTNNEKGTGLGLSLCKEFVELHGGKIWAGSTEGSGSEFYFTIPHRTNKNKVIKSNGVKSGGPKKLKILIAEDNETVVTYFKIILQNLSREILHTKTGTGAVEICRAHNDIDLILMDIRIFEMDGHEATRQIRKFNKEVIIIAQTALALQGGYEKALEAGCNDYLSKPIEKDVLLKKITMLFDV